MSAEPTPPRVVRPIDIKRERLPVIAVSLEEGLVLLEREADLQNGFLGYPLSELPRIIQEEPPSLLIVSDAARMLMDLEPIFQDRPDWQWRVTPIKRDIRKPNQSVGRVQVQGTVVNFFGFKPADKKGRGRYHHPLDPIHFCRAGIHQLIPGDLPLVYKYLAWGIDVREWCASAGIKVKGSGGGVAGQLLRHPKFFPADRRKVPRVTNARARLVLPGNHYRLYANANKAHQAYYLDMQAAHHNIAATLALPHPDDLYARGWFRVTDETDGTVLHGKPWVKANDRQFRNIIDNALGLLYVQISVPRIPSSRFPLPYLEKPGSRMAWVHTNEIPTLLELGVSIDWITAGWFSMKRCRGLNRYARWAMGELSQAEAERRSWLKPTLLATYGVLAARPRVTEYGFRVANGGVLREYPAGSGMLQAHARMTETAQEVPTANVIYRGMIEAEQRKRSLDMARWIDGHGGEVLAVYADSVFVRSDGFQLPLLPEPWTLEAELDRLIFLSSTSFTSRQLTKLPGIPKEAQARYRELERMRSVR